MSSLTARSATVTVVAQVLARGISLGFVILSSAIVARALSVEEFADWATILSLVVIFSFLLDPGLSPVIVRRLAQESETAPTPRAMVAVRVACGLLAMAGVVLVAGMLRGTGALILAAALAAQLIPRAVVLNAQPWLQSDHRLHRVATLEALTSGVALIALVALSLGDASPPLLALAGFALPIALLSVLVRRELHRTPSAALPSPGAQWPKVRAVLVEVAPLAAALALVAVSMRTFTIFVNAAEPDDIVAEFLFAYQFVEQVIVVAGIVAGALLPIIARQGADITLLRTPIVRQLAVGVAALGGFTSAALLALAPVLTELIGSAKLAGADRYLELLSPIAAVLLPAFLLAYVYLAIGQARRYLVFNAIALTVSTAGNAIFTLSQGASAAARVAWATELVVVVLAAWPLLRSADGRESALRILAIIGLAVAGAELAYAGALPAVAAALLPAVGSLVLGRHELRRFWVTVRAPQPD